MAILALHSSEARLQEALEFNALAHMHPQSNHRIVPNPWLLLDSFASTGRARRTYGEAGVAGNTFRLVRRFPETPLVREIRLSDERPAKRHEIRCARTQHFLKFVERSETSHQDDGGIRVFFDRLCARQKVSFLIAGLNPDPRFRQ
jgi:hypothetical protein